MPNNDYTGTSAHWQDRRPPQALSVSVVIPFYKDYDTIERAVASVSAQTVAVSEVIIVDDCSPPGRHDELESLRDEECSPPVRILYLESNQGPAAARNRGWSAANGEWVAFLDSDDSWHPRRIELQYNALSPQTLMISTCSALISGDEEPLACPDGHDLTAVRLGLNRHLVQNPHATSSVLVRRDVTARFTAGRFYAEDYELWIRIASMGEVLKLRAPLTYLHKHAFSPHGLSSRIWRMIQGEQQTFSLLRQQRVISGPQFLFAELAMTARVGRRLAIRTVSRIRLVGATKLAAR